MSIGGLLLHRFESWVGFADNVKTTSSLNDLAVRMTALSTLKRFYDFHLLVSFRKLTKSTLKVSNTTFLMNNALLTSVERV